MPKINQEELLVKNIADKIQEDVEKYVFGNAMDVHMINLDADAVANGLRFGEDEIADLVHDLFVDVANELEERRNAKN